ncbi:MAG: hypothetical protein ACLQNE_46055 [Thermoguttaceae bacterium]
MPKIISSSSDPSLNSIDGISLHGAQELLSERYARNRVSIDYTRLIATLNHFREEEGWKPATTTTMHLSADPSSEGSQRFQTMLRHAGIELDVIHYRDTFVSLPPGRSPAESSSKPISSFASRLTYVAGLMARFPDSQLLIVSHAFELCGPLVDLARRLSGGRVGIAYFASLLDYRWRLAGLLDGKLQNVDFCDLDPYGKDLVGIDLVGQAPPGTDIRNGLSRF